MLEQNYYKKNRGLSDYEMKESRTKDALFSRKVYFLSQSEKIVYLLEINRTLQS